jgi:hypothetical protein
MEGGALNLDFQWGDPGGHGMFGNRQGVFVTRLECKGWIWREKQGGECAM